MNIFLSYNVHTANIAIITEENKIKIKHGFTLTKYSINKSVSKSLL